MPALFRATAPCSGVHPPWLGNVFRFTPAPA